MKKIVPQCEKCWVEENAVWEPDYVTSEGDIVSRLVRVDVPTSVELGAVHGCADCGSVTVVGLKVERDVEEINYDSGELNLKSED